jgi:hypothetical protein
VKSDAQGCSSSRSLYPGELLGLRLESSKLRIEMFVIAHIEPRGKTNLDNYPIASPSAQDRSCPNRAEAVLSAADYSDVTRSSDRTSVCVVHWCFLPQGSFSPVAILRKGSQILGRNAANEFYRCAATVASGMSALASLDDAISCAPVCFNRSFARAVFSDVSQ